MHDSDPTKRIPKSLGTDTNAFGKYSLMDVAVGLFPAVVLTLTIQVVVPSGTTFLGFPARSLSIPLGLLGVGVGAIIVYLTPAYTDSMNWLVTFSEYLSRESRREHETAREYTQVQLVHPDRDTIERQDGAVVGAVQVDPPMMGLASLEEWTRKADGFENFLNTTVEFPVQLYSTTQTFPVEDYLQQFEQRLDDEDVEDNPQLESMIERYVDWYGDAVTGRESTIREHYVIVTVHPREVRFEKYGLIGQFADLPGVGLLLTALFGPSEIAEREALFEELDTRIRRVENGIREIEGCRAHRLDTTAITGLLRTYWTGVEEPQLASEAFRTKPMVGGTPQ